jgi:hypothetical protein
MKVQGNSSADVDRAINVAKLFAARLKEEGALPAEIRQLRADINKLDAEALEDAVKHLPADFQPGGCCETQFNAGAIERCRAQNGGGPAAGNQPQAHKMNATDSKGEDLEAKPLNGAEVVVIQQTDERGEPPASGKRPAKNQPDSKKEKKSKKQKREQLAEDQTVEEEVAPAQNATKEQVEELFASCSSSSSSSSSGDEGVEPSLAKQAREGDAPGELRTEVAPAAPPRMWRGGRSCVKSMVKCGIRCPCHFDYVHNCPQFMANG